MLTSPKFVNTSDEGGCRTLLSYQDLTISLGNGAVSTSDECRTFWGSDNGEFDFLVLFDSRGAMVDGPDSRSTVELLANYFTEIGARFLILSRPLYLTVFPTLLSVMESQDITVKHVITNVGFVDTTPKKKSVLEDLEAQISACGLQSASKGLGDYTLSSGDVEYLATSELEPDSIIKLSERLSKCASTYCFVNTPIISQSRALPRPRPSVFYQQLEVCNKLIETISEKLHGHILDVSEEQIVTFDGVHYLSNEHQFIFNRIEKYIAGLENK